jgi:hypothetical protein
LGTPGDFIPIVGRGYLVIDGQNSRLVEFDAIGKVVRLIGGKGGGPGEFNGITTARLDGDSVLYVFEPLLVNLLDYRTGHFRRKDRLPAAFLSSIAVKNSQLYFSALDSTQTPHLSVWRQGTVLLGPRLPAASDLDAVKAAGAIAMARMMNTTHSSAVFTPLNADTIAILSQSSESIFLSTPQSIIAEIPVARSQRQGVRADVIAQIAADPNIAQRDPQLLYTPSVPTAVGRNGAGEYYSVKTDLTFLGKRFSAKLFLSVTNPNNKLSCPDVQIPGPEDPRPSVAFHGDTLVVLSQEVRGTVAVTMIRKYRIQTKNCKWVSSSPT